MKVKLSNGLEISVPRESDVITSEHVSKEGKGYVEVTCKAKRGNAMYRQYLDLESLLKDKKDVLEKYNEKSRTDSVNAVNRVETEKSLTNALVKTLKSMPSLLPAMLSQVDANSKLMKGTKDNIKKALKAAVA